MPAKTVENQRSFHKYCVSSVKDLIEDISTDENLQYDELLEGKKDIQQLLSELENTNEFLPTHTTVSFQTRRLKSNVTPQKKLNMVRRKFQVSCDLVNNSADTETRMPTITPNKKHIELNKNKERFPSNSNLPFPATITRNLSDQNTFLHQHQPSFSLANGTTTLNGNLSLPDRIRKPPNTKTWHFQWKSTDLDRWIKIFESIIDSRRLSTTEKMRHLQSLLTGQTMNLVSTETLCSKSHWISLFRAIRWMALFNCRNLLQNKLSKWTQQILD